jgi:hypothetical protein
MRIRLNSEVQLSPCSHHLDELLCYSLSEAFMPTMTKSSSCCRRDVVEAGGSTQEVRIRIRKEDLPALSSTNQEVRTEKVSLLCHDVSMLLPYYCFERLFS